MKISSNFKNLPIEIKEEIRDIAISMSNAVENHYFGSKFKVDLYHKLSKAYSFYQKYYKTNLSEDEKSVFYLYVTFPNDNRFMEIVDKYEKDFQQISNIYLVPEIIVKLRYLLQKNIMFENEFEKYTKKKTMN